MLIHLNTLKTHFMTKPLIHLASDWLYYSTTRLDNSVHATIPQGISVVIGPNGAGKSLLGEIIERGRNFRTNRILSATGKPLTVKKVEFADIHSLRGIAATGYYQQRYEATMNDEVPTVAQVIDRAYDIEDVIEWCRHLGLGDIRHKRINYLSSGELRKLLIATALTSRPDLLVLDNPYIGLDETSREILDDAIASLPTLNVNVLMLVCDPRDIPPSASVIIPVVNMSLREPVEANSDIARLRDAMMHLFDYAIDTSRLPRPLAIDDSPVDHVVRFDNCPISYGSTTIIDSIDWTIRDNERWALQGPNGSGKSTILSLINADNPAGYRSNITLFDRRRGTGESIWDIKHRIGYVSPEMRLYFSGTGNAQTVIGQGLTDTVGSYVKLRPDQEAQAGLWIRLLHLEEIARRPYNTLSAGERQMVLLARAMIKQPRLMILDEPMHGLDYGRKRAMRALVNYFAARADLPGSRYPMSLIYVTHHRDELPECINHTMKLSSNAVK
ncbi:MAG: ATP-binding cassette domain-containing protein [Muribaculaceae bacterium]|nr:ATP-binding cassette domain-containing protein [Muribaculaceae bacterium]